jgi:hypothetical protein
MPRTKEEIFSDIVKKVADAAQHLDSFGCSVGEPRIQEILSEAAGLMWEALTKEEWDEFQKLVPVIAYSASNRKVRCPDIHLIREEEKKFREWKIRTEVEREWPRMRR